MSIARAFTKRVKSPDMPDFIANRRADAARDRKSTTPQITRSKISAPVALLSTTNMLSYNAPDVSAARHASSSSASDSSASSAEDSDHGSSSGSQDGLTDASSVELSPISPKPNHLSEYFSQATNKKASVIVAPPPPPAPPALPAPPRPERKSEHKSVVSISSTAPSTTSSDRLSSAPAIPQRALSHSKRAHEQLARKRSMHSVSNSVSSVGRSSVDHVRASREQRSSLDILSGTIVESDHPFGKELQQLTEVAEEFGSAIKDAARDEDFAIIVERGLCAFSAADYMSEIQPLFSCMFEVRPIAIQAGWI